MGISGSGWDDIEGAMLREAEEALAEEIVAEALENGLESIDQVELNLDDSSGKVSAARVRRRAEELFRQRSR